MNAYDYGPGLEQVVADYLAENNPYTPYTDGRVMAAATEPMMEETAPAMEEAAPAEEMVPAEEAAPAEEMEPAEGAVEVPEPLPGFKDLTTSAPMISEEAAPSEEAKMSEEPAATEMDAMPGKMHTVKSGDTLWELARTYFGDATMWTKIAEANPSAVAKDLVVGETLTIPAE